VRIPYQSPGSPVSPLPTTHTKRLPDTLTNSAGDGVSPDGRLAAGPSSAGERVPHHSARGALSWLKEFIIEGLAAYGYALYPCFVEPSEDVDRRGVVEGGQRSCRVSHQDPEDKFQSREMPFGFEDYARIRHPPAPSVDAANGNSPSVQMCTTRQVRS
jgi:hypothetical protein